MNRRITWTHKCLVAAIAIGIAAVSATYGLSRWQVPDTPPRSNLGRTYTERSISSEQSTLMERIRSSASGSKENKEFRKQLRILVSGELDQRLANQATELAHIERRLVDAKAKLAQGTVKRTEIVERRVNQLLQEPDELEWSNTIATQPLPGLLLNEGSYQRVGAGDETVPVTSMNANQNSAVSAMPPSSYEHAIRSLPQENTSSEHFPTVGATSVSKQAADLQNEALEVEATFDVEFVDLGEEARKAKALELSLAKRVRLLELKAEALDSASAIVRLRLKSEMELGMQKVDWEKKDVEISENLLRRGAEDMKVVDEKKRRLVVAETELSRWRTELMAFDEHRESLSTRISKIRLKLNEVMGSKSGQRP